MDPNPAIVEGASQPRTHESSRPTADGIAVLDGGSSVRYAYDVSPDVEARCLAYAREMGEKLDDSHTMLVGDCDSVAGTLGRLTEQRLFDGEWSGHGPEMMRVEYGRYEQQSVHAVITDEVGVVATARTIWSPSLALPTKVEVDLGAADGRFREHHRLVERYGSIAFSELATAAVDPRARGGLVTGWILGEMRYQQMCLRAGSPSCAMIAVAFYRMIRGWGHDMAALGGRKAERYLGVPSKPAFFEPGPQSQIKPGAQYADLSVGWLSRAQRPLSETVLDEARLDATVIDLREVRINRSA